MSKIAQAAVLTSCGFHSDKDLHPSLNLMKPRKANSSNLKGPYLIGETIGEGAFAKVKVATHIQTNEKVAIKILDKTKFFKDVEDIARVEKEIAILKKLKHKNIIQLYEIMESQKNLYIVMEYCEGKELFDFIVKRRKLSEVEACKFFQEIVNALEYLHLNNITHRDLKPENLLLDYKKNIKISDFGLSTTYKKGNLLSTPCGTPNYAPPEMLRGDEYNGMLSDVWSCGIILYAMLCGYLPFSESKEQIIYQKIIEHDYEYPSFLSESAVDLLRRILNVDPGKRFDITRIKRHPWFNLVPANLKPGISIGKMLIPIDERILRKVESLGIDKETCRSKILQNKYDSVTTIYYLCLKRFIKEGGKSNSDLNSSQFIEYVRSEKERLGILDEEKDIGNSGIVNFRNDGKVNTDARGAKEEEFYQEVEINEKNKLDTEREPARAVDNDDEVGLVANDRYSDINHNVNTNEASDDPANAEGDIIDENIESHKELILEKEIFSKQQKNCLSDRANKSKINFLQETQKIQLEKETLKCDIEFLPNRNPFGEKAYARNPPSSKMNSNKNQADQAQTILNIQNSLTLDDFSGKTRNGISKTFINPNSSRTLESKENTLLIVDAKDEKSLNKNANLSFLVENFDLDNKDMEFNSNGNFEDNKTNQEIYENIIEIVANLNQKNALNYNRFNEDGVNLTERSEKYSRREKDSKNNGNGEKLNKRTLNSDSESASIVGAKNNIMINSNTNLITEINNLDLSYHDDNKNQNEQYYGNRDNNEELAIDSCNVNNKNSISKHKKNILNSDSKSNLKPKLFLLNHKENHINSKYITNNPSNHQINNFINNNNQLNTSKEKSETQSSKIISSKTATPTPNNPNTKSNKTSTNKNIFNVNFSTANKTNTNKSNTNKANINSIFDKNLIMKNLRKVSTGEGENLNRNLNYNVIQEDKVSKNVLNSEGSVGQTNRNNSNSNNKHAAKQQQDNSKTKKIKSIVTKIANNLGNDLKITKQKNLILQNFHVKSFVSSKTNITNITNNNSNNNNNHNLNHNVNSNLDGVDTKISSLKKANLIEFNKKFTSKNPSFASNNNNNNDLNIGSDLNGGDRNKDRNKNSFFESLKFDLNLNNKLDKLNAMYYRNSICFPTEANSFENKIKTLLSSQAKDKAAEPVNLRERLKEYSASIASPYEIKKAYENQHAMRKDSFALAATSQEKNKLSTKYFSKEKQNKKINFNNNNAMLTKCKEKEIILFDNKSKDSNTLKSKEKESCNNVSNSNKNQSENNQPVKKFPKVISLNTQLINHTVGHSDKNIKKSVFSPSNKYRISNQIHTVNDTTPQLDSLTNNLKNNKSKINSENLSGSFAESKISKNKIVDLNSKLNNYESKFAHDFNNKPQSTKNKLKISINKNYVKSPVNTELRSHLNIFSNANHVKNNNLNGKFNASELVLNINDAHKNQRNALNNNFNKDAKNNEKNLYLNSSRVEEQNSIIRKIKSIQDTNTPSFIKSGKSNENDVFIYNNNNDFNSNGESENAFSPTEKVNMNSYNPLVNSCNYNEIKRMQLNELNDNKHMNTKALEEDEKTNENNFFKNSFAQRKGSDACYQETELEQELNKLELYPNINVLEYIANKLVEKSISNMETSMKTNGENSTTVYSNLCKSFFKSDCASQSKKLQMSSIQKSTSNSKNTNTISIEDAKETKKDFFTSNSENDSLTEDEEIDFLDFEEMMGLFNQKFRNAVCNQKIENKENSFITVERNNETNHFSVNTIECANDNKTNGENSDVHAKRDFASEKNIVATGKTNNNLMYNRNDFNRNMANSFGGSPISKNMNTKINFNNNANNNAVANGNLAQQQQKNNSKYSKSFVVKGNNLNEKSNTLSNNNNINISNKSNHNIVNAIRSKENNNNNSKSKNKLLRKFPHKTNLNVGKDRNNVAANRSNNVKTLGKNEKKSIKIKEIKEVSNPNNNKLISNNQNMQVNADKIFSFKSPQKSDETRITLATISNPLSNNNSGAAFPLNNNYYRKIIGNKTNINLIDNNASSSKNVNKDYLRKEEKSFFSDKLNSGEFLSSQHEKKNNSNLQSIQLASNSIDSNSIDTNSVLDTNPISNPPNQDPSSVNHETAVKKPFISRINLTNNLFNKNAFLDISATYDPDLDSKNETSVERSKSIRNRNKLSFVHQLSLSPKRNINLASVEVKKNNHTNLKTLNLNIRDSSVSSTNSNVNETLSCAPNNANLNTICNSNYFENNANYDSVRMVDNANDVISNYDYVNLSSNEKNKMNCNLTKNSFGQSSNKVKRFGSIGIISEDDEFSNQNMSVIKSKEPFNSVHQQKISSENTAIKIKEYEKTKSSFNEILSEANKINFHNNKVEFNKDKKYSLSQVLSFNEEVETNKDHNTNSYVNPQQIKHSIFNSTVKNKASDYSPIKIINNEINSNVNVGLTTNSSHQIGNSSKGNSIQKSYMKNAYPIEKRVTIDLADSIIDKN